MQMDHSSEQLQELDALQAIYGDELEVLNGDYPSVSFTISVTAENPSTIIDSDGIASVDDSSVSCKLFVSLNAAYPESAPTLRLAMNSANDDDNSPEEDPLIKSEFTLKFLSILP